MRKLHILNGPSGMRAKVPNFCVIFRVRKGQISERTDKNMPDFGPVKYRARQPRDCG